MDFGSEKIVYDILINGKPAKDSIEDVEKSQNKLDKTVEKTSRNITMNWRAIGASATVAATAMMALAKQSLDLEKAMFGLNQQTKDYIQNASNYYAVSQEIVAGFVQTGKAAGMSGEKIKTMIEQAVALSRAYPQESIETFIDNLSMLSRTGEAQGYIIDVLAQKWGTIDLKSKTLAEKMAVIEEATRGVNAEFNKTAGAKVDQLFQEITNEVLELGDGFVTMGEKAVSSFDKLKKEAKGFFNWLHDKGVISFEFKTDTEKPKDDVILGTIDIVGKSEKITPPKTTSTSSSGQSTADKQKSIALSANERFWREYEKSIMSATEFELSELNKRYTAYAKDVTDKVALEEWLSNEQQRILDVDKERTDQYARYKEQLFGKMGDAFARFTQTGEINFKDMANSIIQDLIRIQTKQLLVGMFSGSGSILDIFGGGSVANTANVTPFASGGIVNTPTLFPMAKGSGLMGESGAEAILPLKRSSNGDLGVTAQSSPVIVNVTNNTSSEVEVQQTDNSLEIVISKISQDIQRGTGSIPRSLESRYGIKKV